MILKGSQRSGAKQLGHSMASRLANEGVPVNEVAAILGHRRGGVTEGYVHFTPQRLRQTVEIASQVWLSLPAPE